MTEKEKEEEEEKKKRKSANNTFKNFPTPYFFCIEQGLAGWKNCDQQNSNSTSSLSP
jgi:hypothetical protein